MHQRIKNLGILLLLLSAIQLSAQTARVWTLKECVEQAFSKNINIQQQQLQTLSAKADYFQSKMALLPNLNGNVTNNWQTGFAINPTTNLAQKGVSFRTNSFGVSSSIPLFAGLQNINNVKVNEARSKASEEDLAQIKNNIALNVSAAYLRVLQNEEIANAAATRTEATKAQVERQQKMYELGSSNKSRYLQLKAQLAGEELTLINAKNALMQAYLELWLLIEVKPDASQKIAAIDTKDLQVADEPKTIDMIFDEFVEKSPDVRATSMRFKASEIQTNIARGGRTPRLTLNASANSFFTTQSQMGFGDTTLRIVPTGTFADNSGTFLPVYATIPGYKEFKTTPFSDQFDRNLGTNVGLNLAIPIFNGWSVSTNIEKAKINEQSAKLQDKLTRNNLYRTISQAYVDFKTAYKRFEANQENLEANKEAFDVSDKQFELGAMNLADYLNTKNSYIRAQSDFTQAKYELVFRRKTLDFYLSKPLY
jgi:outer membrane protein